MARLISDILQAPEPAFTHELKRLEALAGNPKIDLKLISELVQKAQTLAGELGLDRQDTTAKELYYALNKQVLRDNNSLAQKLGITESNSPEEVTRACVDYFEQFAKGTLLWTVKASVIRAQLKKNPPKRTLKILGLRSIDSAIKRESVSQLALFATFCESKTWNDNYNLMASKIKNNDFDRKPINISIVEKKRIDKLLKAGAQLGHFIYKHDETAGIIVVSPSRRFSGDVLYIFDSLLKESNELRRWSAFAKYASVRADFSKWLVTMRIRGFDHASTQYFKLGWSPLHQLLHKKSLAAGPAIFEPHLDHEDVELFDHGKDRIWQYSYLVKGGDGLIISCNISDAILNATNQTPPERAVNIHGRRALYNELFSRYLNDERVMTDYLEVRQ